LVRSGVATLVLFFVLRFTNVYGDPSPWAVQDRGGIYTVLSFLQVSKSPPSLLFLSVTLGVMCLLLVLADRVRGGAKAFLVVFGRVPFFFFILHLAVISATSYLWTYLAYGRGINLSFVSPKEWPATYSPSLLRTYAVWVLLIVLLYFPCRWYARYRAKSKAWWTSYL
jgi:hypothetical protein